MAGIRGVDDRGVGVRVPDGGGCLWQLAAALLIGQTPADAMAAAHRDLQRMGHEQRLYTRYLSLHSLTEKERDTFVPILSGHVHHLSRASDLPRPIRVGNLLRLNLLDYGWDAATWDKLHDPYFSVRVVIKKPWGGGVWHEDNRWYPKGHFNIKEEKQAIAPWVVEGPCSPDMAAQVVEWTGSQAPVVRAEYFFRETATAADDRHYYRFLGVKDEKSFFDLVGFDRKKSEGFRFELRDAVAISGVTLRPRAITRHDSLGGGIWRSLDFAKPEKGKHPLRVLGRDVEAVYEATEIFAHLPSGMWATFIGNAKGEIQDFAPPDIASDHTSLSNDKRVLSGISCFRCHSDAGLQPVNGFFRNLLHPPLELRSYDYQKARELQQQYIRKLEPFLVRDKAIYEAAIKEATGLTSKEYTKGLAAFWAATEDKLIDTKEAARYLGVEPEELVRKLTAHIKAGYPLDPVASVFVQPRAQPIAVRDFEEVLPELYEVMKRFEGEGK